MFPRLRCSCGRDQGAPNCPPPGQAHLQHWRGQLAHVLKLELDDAVRLHLLGQPLPHHLGQHLLLGLRSVRRGAAGISAWGRQQAVPASTLFTSVAGCIVRPAPQQLPRTCACRASLAEPWPNRAMYSFMLAICRGRCKRGMVERQAAGSKDSLPLNLWHGTPRRLSVNPQAHLLLLPLVLLHLVLLQLGTSAHIRVIVACGDRKQ